MTEAATEKRSTATDEELVALFSLDDVDELHEIGHAFGGTYIVETCDGCWVKKPEAPAWNFTERESS